MQSKQQLKKIVVSKPKQRLLQNYYCQILLQIVDVFNHFRYNTIYKKYSMLPIV